MAGEKFGSSPTDRNHLHEAIDRMIEATPNLDSGGSLN
jgi:hypothetical protein